MIRVAAVSAIVAVWYSTTIDLQTMKTALWSMAGISVAFAVLSGDW